MAIDRNQQAHIRAMNNLAQEIASLNKVCKALDENLRKIAQSLRETQTSQELHGVCHSRECSNKQKHNHGFNCGMNCPCENEEKHIHRKACSKNCSEPTCVRE